MFLKPYPFTIGKCEQLVVVHDRVHVLHPQGIHVSIKEDVPPFILVCRLVDLSEDVGEETVCPVSCHGVQYAVQFNDTASFWVQSVEFGHQAKPGG